MSVKHNLIWLLVLTAGCDEVEKDAVDTGAADTGADTDPGVDADGDGWSEEEDCDDDDGAVNPDAAEICDGIDNNCDGSIDEGDAAPGQWYTDSDGDGYGAGSPEEACSQPSGTVGQDGDCDDADASISPDATETWYDGIDADCDGANDYDADGDGDPAREYGGGDCADADAERYEGVGCRIPVDCEHTAWDVVYYTSNIGGVTDIAFDAQCRLLVSTARNGTDYLLRVSADGSTEQWDGYSNLNMGSVAVDHDTGDIIVGYATQLGIGVAQSDATVNIVGEQEYAGASSSLWSNGLLAQSPASIAVDPSGCVWVPNYPESGDVACLGTASGAVMSSSAHEGHIESLDVDSDGVLHISIMETIYAVDADGVASPVLQAEAGEGILDFVIDYNGDIYAETTDSRVLAQPSGGSWSEFAVDVYGAGKLTISPDGYLFRAWLNPIYNAGYEEWALGDGLY